MSNATIRHRGVEHAGLMLGVLTLDPLHYAGGVTLCFGLPKMFVL